jgi:hypothetical protein
LWLVGFWKIIRFFPSLWPILEFSLLAQTWVLSLCFSLPHLLVVLFNGVC